ncbi:MAG TPA: glycosyltransferase [Candidatus Nanoarchaeia archaeon]|nr:glycosyltransferase [Candidatus Nanoarchaeia archaeon]
MAANPERAASSSSSKTSSKASRSANAFPFISIIVPVKGEANYVLECVSSLLNLDYPKDKLQLIIVLDKLATKEAKQALAAYKGKITILQSPKAGSAANRNFGAKRADRRAKLLAFTDADCIVSTDWLRNLVLAYQDVQKFDKSIKVLGGPNLVPKSDNGFAKVVGALEQSLLGGGGSAQGAPVALPRAVSSIPNCNAIYERRLWEENQQDESLIIGQDGEFNYRLSKQGTKFMVIPGATVWHHRSRTFKGFLRKMYKYGVATGRIFRKHPGILAVRWYALLSLIVMLLGLAILIAALITSNVLLLYIVAILAAIYILALLITTVQTFARSREPLALLTPLLLFLQHVLYNAGLISGMLQGNKG